MKRNIILLTLLAIFISGCWEKKQNSRSGNDEQPGTCIKFDTLKIEKAFPLDTLNAESPALSVDINLLLPETANEEIKKNINNGIAYVAFGLENMTPREAADSVVETLAREYHTLFNDYINEKSISPSTYRFSAYYMVNTYIKEGRGNSLCYFVDSEIYEGGAHPYGAINIINFDKSSGKEIALYDIFTENSDSLLTDKLVTRLAQQHNAASIEELREKGYLTMNDMYITNNFALEKDSLFFLYNRYEIAPYALGISRIGFSYDELKDILK